MMEVSPEEIAEKFDQIADFRDLESFWMFRSALILLACN